MSLRVVLPALMLLAGCASSGLKADVVRFHQNLQPQAATLDVRPADPALANSLEFQSIAQLVRSELAKHGYGAAPAGQAAALVATISLTVTPRPALNDGDRPRSGVSVGVGVGGGSGTRVGGGVGVGIDLSNIFKGDTKDSSITAAEHVLAVRLAPPDGGTALWEGRATALVQGKGAALPTTRAAELTRLLFRTFPGTSGQTERLTDNGSTK